MSGFTNNFPTLPQSDPNADREADESAARIAALEALTSPPRIGPSPENIAAAQSRIQQLNFQDTVRSAGLYVSGLGTKAAEGLSSMASRFAGNIPFLKAGAKTPSFAALATSAGTAASSQIVKAFGGTAGVVSNTATNNVLSAGTSQASANAINNATGGNQGIEGDHIVTLSNLNDPRNPVLFRVMPEIVENRAVEYEAIAPPQYPGAFQKYKGTNSVQWSINATFVCRTSPEATENLRFLNTLRAWTMPYYGERTAKIWPDRLGAPPPVLVFSGLRKSIIGPVPVVITSLSWNWPRDVDYIPATSPDGEQNNIPFPTVIQVAIQVVESFSTKQFNNFDLKEYYEGDMIGAYSAPATQDDYADETARLLARYPKPREAQTIVGAGRGFVNPPSVGTAAAASVSTQLAGISVPMPKTSPAPAISEIKPAPAKLPLPPGYTKDRDTGVIRNAAGIVDRDLTGRTLDFVNG